MAGMGQKEEGLLHGAGGPNPILHHAMQCSRDAGMHSSFKGGGAG